jgi:hypothetical protein
MINDFNANKETWWIATDGITTHYGKISTGEVLSTLLTITTFETEGEWLEALGNIGIQPELGVPNVEVPVIDIPEPPIGE